MSLAERVMDAAAAQAELTGDPPEVARVAARAASLGLREAATRLLAGVEGARDEAWWLAMIASVYSRAGDAAAVKRLIAKIEERWKRGGTKDEQVQNELLSLALAYERIGEDKQADAVAARIVGISPAGNLAVEAARRGALERAERLAYDVARGSEEHAGWRGAALLALADANAKRGDEARAVRFLDEAASVARGMEAGESRGMELVEVAAAYARAGEQRKALELAKAADKDVKKSKYGYGVPWHLALTDAFRAAGDEAKAKQILDSFVAFHAQATPSGYALAARVLAERGEADQSLDLIIEAEEKIRDKVPSDLLAIAARKDLARAFALLGDFDGAIEQVAALEQPKDREEALLDVADTAAAQGAKTTPVIEAALAKLAGAKRANGANGRKP